MDWAIAEKYLCKLYNVSKGTSRGRANSWKKLSRTKNNFKKAAPTFGRDRDWGEIQVRILERLRHTEGAKSNSMGKISSRPRSMLTVSTVLARGEKAA